MIIGCELYFKGFHVEQLSAANICFDASIAFAVIYLIQVVRARMTTIKTK